ncbi:MAG: tRNA (guanosine(37)-N1)-methyltransferase TrmD [Sandaracinaceae bacterium]
MRITVVTLFEGLIAGYASEGLLGKAQAAGRVVIDTVSPREFAKDRHRTVDDAPYGGGSGMVMMPGPLVEAIEEAEARSTAAGASRPWRVLLTPQGEPFRQSIARDLAAKGALTLVCGRYEGVDERVRAHVDQELSLGDFVVMGGEVGALAVIEATTRLLDGVLGNAESVEEESHAHGLLEYPQYTRPAEFRGAGVPAILLSGDHAAVARWRHRQAVRRTAARRPDLLDGRVLSDDERRALETDEPDVEPRR